ncbi:hypothetical protein M231_06892 [Tremella mesenterica]|uniref:Uncharacterized protein n=1 Tax=Tremella mesenterica TaxID=5217 RepID=A0A4Q1BDA5_TREME|nr:hypothetical protein M231_06892 [Tremella mesenterica]
MTTRVKVASQGNTQPSLLPATNKHYQPPLFTLHSHSMYMLGTPPETCTSGAAQFKTPPLDPAREPCTSRGVRTQPEILILVMQKYDTILLWKLCGYITTSTVASDSAQSTQDIGPRGKKYWC